MIFKKLYILLLLTLTLTITACGSEDKDDTKVTPVPDKVVTKSPEADKENTDDNNADGSDNNQENDNTTSKVSLLEVYDELSKAVEFDPLFQVQDEYAFNLFGIDVTTLDDSIIYLAEDVMSAEAVIICKTSSGDNRATIKDLLNGYIDSKKTELEDYNPENYQIVADSEVIEKGDYVYLVISKNVDDANEFLDKTLA